MEKRFNGPKKILVALVQAYKNIVSPYVIKSCRYEPTCSVYAVEAFKRYGVRRGSAKAIWRILRCNPFSRGGYDPV